MDAITAMLTRKSVRKFTQDPVKDEDLRTILDCGRLAPSGVNRQAWRFIVLKSQEMKEKVAAVCDYGHFIDQAPVVIAVASNDGLSGAAANIGTLLGRKNYYFVPFGQDDPKGKPCSLIADFSRISDTVSAALQKKQIQPLLLG